MKVNFRIVALALATMAFAVACKNAPAEEVADTMPAIDTTVIDTVVEEPAVEEPVVEEVVTKAPAKKKSKVEQVVEDAQTVKKVAMQTKKDAAEVANDLKQGEGNSVKPSAQVTPGKKQSAAEAFKKN